VQEARRTSTQMERPRPPLRCQDFRARLIEAPSRRSEAWSARVLLAVATVAVVWEAFNQRSRIFPQQGRNITMIIIIKGIEKEESATKTYWKFKSIITLQDGISAGCTDAQGCIGKSWIMLVSTHACVQKGMILALQSVQNCRRNCLQE
jgi:hypothetical protein